MSAISSPIARMNGSAIRKILMLSLKPSTTSGQDDLKLGQLRKARRNESQPVEFDRMTPTIVSSTMLLTSAMAIDFQRAACFQGGTGVSNTWICSRESSPGTGAGGALIGSSFWLLHGDRRSGQPRRFARPKNEISV